MILQDILDTARYSELSSLAIKDNDAAIVTFLNLGMLELYKRFPIKVEEATITLVANSSMYNLPANFMYPMGAYGEDKDGNINAANELATNAEDDDNSVFFPNHRQIQIPTTVKSSRVSVVFVAKPETYNVDNLAAEVDLPDTLIEPLLHYIGYKGHLGVRSDGQSENNAHYMRFSSSVKKARELGVAYPSDSWRMSGRLFERGFA